MSIFAFICLYQLLTLKKKVTFRQLFSRPGACDPYMTIEVVDQLLACCDEELAGKLGNLFWEQQDHKNKEQLLSKMTV